MARKVLHAHYYIFEIDFFDKGNKKIPGRMSNIGKKIGNMAYIIIRMTMRPVLVGTVTFFRDLRFIVFVNFFDLSCFGSSIVFHCFM